MKKVRGFSLVLVWSVAFVTLVSAQQDAKKTSPPATKSSAGGPKSAATEAQDRSSYQAPFRWRV